MHKVGRLAFRVEGSQWNAYWALPDTMQDAVFLGSIPMAAARKPEIKDAFMALMQEVVSVLLPGAAWPDPPQRAPEHERGGTA